MRNICLVGGDRRNLELAKLLLDDKDNYIKMYANEKIYYEIIESKRIRNEDRYSNLEECTNLEKAIANSNIVVTGIPISKDKEYLIGEYTNLKISLEEFFLNLKNNFLISGMVPEKFNEVLKKNNNELLDILKDERYIITNAKITVEGIIKYLIENTKKTIFNSKILVLGYGRIGKILCNVLKNFTENIYCMPNCKEEQELLKANAINTILKENLNNNLTKFEIIVNTIPKLILNRKEIELLNKEVFVLDIASKPGGINRKIALENNIKFLWKLGIPAEISPITCAEKIKNIIYENNVTYILQ